MKTIGIIGVSLIYLSQAAYLLFTRDYAQAIMLLGYTVANVGLILTFY